MPKTEHGGVSSGCPAHDIRDFQRVGHAVKMLADSSMKTGLDNDPTEIRRRDVQRTRWIEQVEEVLRTGSQGS